MAFKTVKQFFNQPVVRTFYRSGYVAVTVRLILYLCSNVLVKTLGSIPGFESQSNN